MDTIFDRLLGEIAYALFTSLLAYLAVYLSRRKKIKITLWRGILTWLVGWVLGGAILFLAHLIAEISGFKLDESLQIGLLTLVLLGAMYILFGLFGRKNSPASPQPFSPPTSS